MSSKFQNRLTGTIVLFTLGVISLPRLLDGQKNHYHDEFAAIPLVLPNPNPGDRDESYIYAASPQALPSSQPTAAGAAAAEEWQSGGNAAASPQPDPYPSMLKVNTKIDTDPTAALVVQPKLAKAVVENSMLAEQLIAEKKSGQDEDLGPIGNAWVIQLGALKNADKVNEIVGKLRGVGYRVYTSPTTPMQGKITRILVGPATSKEKLKGSLSALKQISGLSGMLMNYSLN